MSPTGLKLAALLAVATATIVNSGGQQDTLVDYLVSVVQSLAGRTIGVYHCVFYGTQVERPFGNTVGRVLADSRLDFVTRSIVTNDYQAQMYDSIAYPMLMFVEGNQISRDVWNFVRIFAEVKPNSKLIVLFSLVSDFKRYERYLRILGEPEVVFIDVIRHRMLVANLGSKSEFDYLVNPDDLFVGTLSRRYNLKGKPLSYSCMEFRTFFNAVWMHETAIFLNTSSVEVGHPCESSVRNTLDLCYWNFFTKEKVEIDLTGLRFDDKKAQLRSFDIMFTNIMSGDVFAVPRSALNVVQLFTMPFSWQVWATLVMILVTAEIIHLTIPSRIRNDPILLVLCGYESFNLHQAKLLEKMLMMPLIVLMFFATCAYESKLLSMMASKPASKDIRSIPELIESGIKIKVDLCCELALVDNPTIRDSLVNSTVDYFNLDMVHAYLLKKDVAKFLSSLYYDPGQRIHRYGLLDEPYTVQPISFVLRYRSPLREVLHYTLTVLFESGIYDFVQKYNIKWDQSFLKPKFNGTLESDTVLYFADFLPIWIVFALGIGASAVVCILEILNEKIKALLSSKKKIRRRRDFKIVY